MLNDKAVAVLDKGCVVPQEYAGAPVGGYIGGRVIQSLVNGFLSEDSIERGCIADYMEHQENCRIVNARRWNWRWTKSYSHTIPSFTPTQRQCYYHTFAGYIF